MIRYLDASALAKRYIQEEHSDAVIRLASRGTVATSRLSEPEVGSALARRTREGNLTIVERDRLVDVMRRDMASLHVVEITSKICGLACEMLMRHKLRASDSVHLASAVYLGGRIGAKVQFIAFDEGLNEAAKREGLALPAF